jgi:hypothetical protein
MQGVLVDHVELQGVLDVADSRSCINGVCSGNGADNHGHGGLQQPVTFTAELFLRNFSIHTWLSVTRRALRHNVLPGLCHATAALEVLTDRAALLHLVVEAHVSYHSTRFFAKHFQPQAGSNCKLLRLSRH